MMKAMVAQSAVQEPVATAAAEIRLIRLKMDE